MSEAFQCDRCKKLEAGKPQMLTLEQWCKECAKSFKEWKKSVKFSPKTLKPDPVHVERHGL